MLALPLASIVLAATSGCTTHTQVFDGHSDDQLWTAMVATARALMQAVDADIMRALDKLLQAFVEQHRMKLPGGAAYVPCYRVRTA